MTEEGRRPCQGRKADVEHVGWTAAEALLQAQTTGYRAMEDYLLMMHYHDTESLEAREVDVLIDDAIEAHTEIIEDLECARDALDTLAGNPVGTS